MFASVDDVIARFEALKYITSRTIGTVVYLATALKKPILVEGPAGVGKTELAKSVAAFLDLTLIRMQCYEGLDESKALYEWKYGKQLLYTQILKDKIGDVIGATDTLPAALDKLHAFGDIFFSHQFLEPRPLLRALQQPGGAVLLIDEIDKTDQEFEAMLLEVLSDFQISIPELGVIEARTHPIVVLTSNNSRELTEALKRRCLYLWLDYPELELELEIVKLHTPELSDVIGRKLVEVIHQVRELDLKKPPSIAESIDWARALLLLGADDIDQQTFNDTMSIIVKHRTDLDIVVERVGAKLGGPLGAGA
jgi:MoxR-like ATPase